MCDMLFNRPWGVLWGVVMSVKIPLNKGKFTIVDDEDWGEISKYKWSVEKGPYTCYAVRAIYSNGKWTTMRLHRQLLNAKAGEEVDHIDHNGLNNTRNNLRACTRSQNHGNQRLRKNCSSQFKGVCWHKVARKWVAYIMLNSNQMHLGLYVDEIVAAKVYDKAAIKYFGEFAHTHFIKGAVT